MTITTLDFANGLMKISQDQNDYLANWITLNQNRYTRDILGYALGQDLIANPAEAKYTSIVAPFDYESNGYNVHCEGLKFCVMALIYEEYITDTMTAATKGGNQTLITEAASKNFSKKTVIYNRAVEAINVLQHFVQLDPTTYPNYNGYTYNFSSSL